MQQFCQNAERFHGCCCSKSLEQFLSFLSPWPEISNYGVVVASQETMTDPLDDSPPSTSSAVSAGEAVSRDRMAALADDTTFEMEMESSFQMDKIPPQGEAATC